LLDNRLAAGFGPVPLESSGRDNGIASRRGRAAAAVSTPSWRQHRSECAVESIKDHLPGWVKNLIITSSFGYQAVQLIPFLESAHLACREADVTIITTASDAARLGSLKDRYPNLSFFLIPERKPSRPVAKDTFLGKARRAQKNSSTSRCCC